MELNSLTAISPIDGRYRHQVQHLDDYFSEYALIRYRVLVGVEYFLFLNKKKFFSLSAAARRQLHAHKIVRQRRELAGDKISNLFLEFFGIGHSSSHPITRTG